MHPLLLVLYVAMSLFPLAAGAGLHQYLMGASAAARSSGGVLLFAVGGLCTVGYVVMLQAMHKRMFDEGRGCVTWRSLTVNERVAVVTWPLAFVAAFALTALAAGMQ